MDGKIVLKIHPRLKRTTWYYRISNPESSKIRRKRYLEGSTKTSDLEEAKQLALKIFYETAYKVSAGMTIENKTFEQTAKEYLERNKLLLNTEQLSNATYKIRKSHCDTYFIPFFGKKPIEQITAKTINEFWEWRLTFWTTGPGKSKEKPQRFAPIPAEATLKLEAATLGILMKYAAQKGYIRTIPEYKPPKAKAKAATTRPVIEDKHLKIIRQKYNEWIDDAYDKRQRFARQRTKCLIEIMLATGMRPQDPRELRWKDYKIMDNKIPLFDIDGNTTRGKKRKRICIAREFAKNVMEEWKNITPYTKDTDYIWPNADGTKFDNQLDPMFKSMLEWMKIEADKENYTIYSLRHTYATEQIKNGTARIEMLAENMGTSIKMIEQHYNHLRPMQAAYELARITREKKD